MTKWTFLGAVLLAAAPALADHTLIVTKAGYYLLQQDANGVPSLHKVEHVIELDRPEPQPTPTPTPTPTPSTLTERGKAIKAAAEKVTADPDREGTARILAMLYREVSKLARDPTKVKDEASLSAGLKQATDTVLASTKTPEAWNPVRAVLGTQWTIIKARAGSLADYATLLDEAADGLDASAPSRRVNPDILNFILELLKILLPLFFPR